MAIAAVPAYLGKDFSSASPGLRFNMYVPIWQENTWRRVESKVEAIKPATKLNDSDKQRMNALRHRQAQLATTIQESQCLRIEAVAIAPFSTGLGNEHPLENGFAFLNPYGLPYLAGSGVKGVLRQAARELASEAWGDGRGWRTDKSFPLLKGEGEDRKPVPDSDNQPVMLSMLDALFGLESADGDQVHVRGALTFWDVIPGIEGDALKIEIMTPHQSHYLQGDATPHDSGQPNPINFLTVPPKSKFDFVIQCDLPFLERITPELARDGRWKTLMQAALQHAFDWLGFGAKTAVGYGAMQEDPALKKRREDEAARRQEEREQAERAARFSPQGLLVDDFARKCAEKDQLRQANPAIRKDPLNPGQGIYAEALRLSKTAADNPDWSADDRKQLADVLAEWLPKLVDKLDVTAEWKDARRKLQLTRLGGG